MSRLVASCNSSVPGCRPSVPQGSISRWGTTHLRLRVRNASFWHGTCDAERNGSRQPSPASLRALGSAVNLPMRLGPAQAAPVVGPSRDATGSVADIRMNAIRRVGARIVGNPPTTRTPAPSQPKERPQQHSPARLPWEASGAPAAQEDARKRMVQRVRDANRATQAIPRAGAPPRKGDPSARRPPPGTHPSAAARRGGPSKARDIKRLAMEVGMESMRQCLEDIGVELLRDEVWTQLKRVVPLEDEWRPQISLLAAMGFRAADLERLVDAREDILLFKPKGLKEKLDYLEKEVGLSREEVRKTVLRCPRILEYKPGRSIAPRVAWMRKELGLSKAEVARVVVRAPQVVSLSLEESLKPRAEFLARVGGVEVKCVGKILRKHPLALTYSEDSMQKRVAFLESIGMGAREVARAVQAHPQVLHYRIPAMRKRVEFLAELGLSPEQAAEIFSRIPQAFSLDVEANMRPKVEYLMTQMGATTETLVKYPGILSLSLANRIVPRHKFMSEVGYPIIHPLPNNLLKCSDLEFTAKLGASLEAYSEFKARVANRLTQEGLS